MTVVLPGNHCLNWQIKTSKLDCWSMETSDKSKPKIFRSWSWVYARQRTSEQKMEEMWCPVLFCRQYIWWYLSGVWNIELTWISLSYSSTVFHGWLVMDLCLCKIMTRNITLSYVKNDLQKKTEENKLTVMEWSPPITWLQPHWISLGWIGLQSQKTTTK